MPVIMLALLFNFIYFYPHVINNSIKPLRDMETIIDDIIRIIPDSRMNIIEITG